MSLPVHAQTLSLFLKEVGRNAFLTGIVNKEEEQDGGRHYDSAKVDSLFLKEMAEHGGLPRRGGKEDTDEEEDGSSVALLVNSHFFKCMSNCCFLTIGEDTLLVNIECFFSQLGPQRTKGGRWFY